MTTNTKPPESPRIYDCFDNLLETLPSIGLNMKQGVSDSYISCGVSLIFGLQESTPEQIVNKILKERLITDRKLIREAFVVFSDTVYGRGPILYKYIQDNNLGDIIQMGPRKNPNTGNRIMLWVWAPPHLSLEPRDKNMPIHGKIRVTDEITGRFIRWDDASVKSDGENRFSRGA